jgi:hypothetical protein
VRAGGDRGAAWLGDDDEGHVSGSDWDDGDDDDPLAVMVEEGQAVGGGDEEGRYGEERDDLGDDDFEGRGDEAAPGSSGHGATFYIAHLSDPLYEGCQLTLAEFLVRFVAIKRSGQVRDRPLQEVLDLIREVLPTPNIVPPTLHLVKKALGVPSIADFERHACINCCMVWPHTKRADYGKHMHDKCDQCGEARFSVTTYSELGKHRVTPRRAWWYFDPTETIRAWNTDLEFVQNKRAAVERHEASSFFHEARGEVQRLQARTQGTFLDPGNSYFEIGADGGQMFDKIQHSCVIVVMRCAGLPPQLRSKNKYVKLVMVISGPGEATNLQPFFVPFLSVFQRHGPEGQPLDVYERRPHTDALQLVRETLWLLGAYGDSPMRQKLTLWLGHGAQLGCGFCAMSGTHQGGAVRWVGYSRPHMVTQGRCTGQAHLVGAVALQNDHHRHMVDSMAAKHLTHDQQTGLGCRGVSVFPATLNYVDYNNFFVVPLFHCLLYGVVRTFFQAVFSKGSRGETTPWYRPTSQQLKMMLDREGTRGKRCMFAVSEYSKGPESIVKRMGNFTMDDWLHFVLTWSSHVFGARQNKILPQAVYDLYVQLRSIVKHFCVACDAAEFNDAWFVQGQALLNFFAADVQRRVEEAGAPFSLLSNNLHILVCRLVAQSRARGHPTLENEMWIERAIHTLKEVTRYRASCEPERVAVNAFLLDRALLDMHLRFSCLPDVSGAPRGPEGEGPGMDTLLSRDGCRMKGPALRRNRVQNDADLEMATEYLRAGGQAFAWGDDVLDLSEPTAFQVVSVERYARANKSDDEMLSSLMYGRFRNRVNHWVVVRFEGEEGEGPGTYAARINRFLRVVGTFENDKTVIVRLCVADLFKIAVERFDGDVLSFRESNQWRRPATQALEHGKDLYPFLVSNVDCKCNYCVHNGQMSVLRPYCVSRSSAPV